MADNKFYQVKRTFGGVEYTAQFNGIAAALEAVDSSYIEGSNNISTKKITQYVLDNVIIDPKCSIDDFDSVEQMNEVVNFGRDVMQGNFRNEKDKGATTAKSKE